MVDSHPFTLDAKLLAVRFLVCPRTIRTWDASGLLPSPVRISRAVRWLATEITAWEQAGCPTRETWTVLKAARKQQIVF